MSSRPGLEQIDGSGATRGQVPVWNPDNGGVWEPATPTPAGVSSVAPGTLVVIDNTDPNHPKVSVLVPLTTELNGEFGLVWDDDGNIVYTEAP